LAGAGVVVWSTVAVPVALLADSVAVMVQNPTTLPATYVAVTTPEALVVPFAGAVEQTLDGKPATVKLTVSPETGVPVGPVTVTVRVEVEWPSAGTLAGAAATTTLLLEV